MYDLGRGSPASPAGRHLRRTVAVRSYAGRARAAEQAGAPGNPPVPLVFRTVLDDKAHLADGHLACREGLAELGDHGRGRLVGGAVAERQVGYPLVSSPSPGSAPRTARVAVRAAVRTGASADPGDTLSTIASGW